MDVGNKRFVVRPYRAPKLVNALSDNGTDYVDPNLSPASVIEVAVLSNKAVRLRSDQGAGLPALVDSQQLLSNPVKVELPPAPHAPAVATITAVPPPAPRAPAVPSSSIASSSSKVVLLENSDFRDLEVRDFTSQDIGDGAALYSFAGGSSETQIASNPPIFLVLLAEAEAGGHVELSRLQIGRGTRQLAYSAAKKHSASSLPIVVTQASATVQKVTVKDALPPGEYVVLLDNSPRGFLFEVR